MGLTKAVALETIMTGVTCNAICPHSSDQSSEHRIDTLRQRGTTKEEVIDEFIDQKMPYHQAFRRFITVEEISASVYLCSEAGPRCAEPRSQSMAVGCPLSQQLGTQYACNRRRCRHFHGFYLAHERGSAALSQNALDTR